MAVSRFTQLQYSDTGSPVNMEFMHDTLSGLQTKYDQGFLTIANEIDTYNKLEIVTPRDKEYINRRVNSLTEQLNSISNADLADPKTVGKLTLQARSLASDPEIMKRVRNNKNISQLVDRYTKMKEDPKKLEYYNPINEQRDMEYVNQYLRGERDDMPISSPTLYYNYIKDAEKWSKDMAPTIDYRIKNGVIVKGKFKTEEDLVGMLSGRISSNPAALNQMNIESDAIAKTLTPGEIFQQSIKTATSNIEIIKDTITKYENQIAKTADVTERNELTKVKDRYKTALGEFTTRLDNLNQKSLTASPEDAISLYRDIYRESKLRGIAKGYVVNEQSYGGADPYSLEKVRFDNSLEKLKWEQSYIDRRADQDRAFKREQEENDIMKAMISAGMKTSRESARNLLNGQGVSDNSNVTTMSSYLNNENPYSSAETEIVGLNDNIYNITKDITLSFLQDMDDDLYRKVKSQWDDQRRQLTPNKEYSKKQLEYLNEANSILNSLTNPSQLVNNPKYQKYGPLMNQLNTTVGKKELIQEELNRAERLGFEEWKKENNSPLTYNVWKSGDTSTTPVDKGPTPTTTEELLMARSGNVNANLNMQIRDRVNKFLKERNITTFYKKESIGSENKTWNKGSNLNSTVYSLAQENGIISNEDGRLGGINGRIGGAPINRSGRNMGDIDKISVTGFIHGANAVEIQWENTKEKTNGRGVIKVSPEEFSQLTGTVIPQTDEDFGKALFRMKKPYIQNSDGSPKLYNTLGSIPGFTGNIQYKMGTNQDGTFSVIIDTSQGDLSLKSQLPLKIGGQDFRVRTIGDERRMFSELVTKLRDVAKQTDIAPQDIDKEVLRKFYQVLGTGF